ncbi:MAG: hypothetical protein N2167_03390 [Flavobacteriales bacterium]|nr:hypothetical protein [Flavobacteriales bacterium]
MEPKNLDSHTSQDGNQKKHKHEYKKLVSIHQYRRREKIRARFGVMLLVYACLLIMLGYFLIEIMKIVK